MGKFKKSTGMMRTAVLQWSKNRLAASQRRNLPLQEEKGSWTHLKTKEERGQDE